MTINLMRFGMRELCVVKRLFTNSFIHCCSQTNLPVSVNQNIGIVKENSSVLDICKEDVSDYAPYLSPTFNLAAYANKSNVIQQLVKLGVDLSKIEKKGFSALILGLDFERDIKKYIQFLHDLGVPAEEYGNIFTYNPLLLKEDLDNLNVRISYLTCKKFQAADIVRIVTKNPRWLSHSTQDIDRRLGVFQQQFSLAGDEVRHVAIRMPKIVTFKLQHIEANKFTLMEEMGFNNAETKQLLLQKPKIFVISRFSLQTRIDYLLNTMNIPQSVLVSQPGVILARIEKIKQRHNFLKLIKKDHYDSTKPGYVSMESLVRGNDKEFCANVAGTSVQTYNLYLKSL